MANPIARRLRKTMTPQEVKLWLHLRQWRSRGFHFRRQSPQAGYIVDFICVKHRLVIEVDGGQHGFEAHRMRDANRDADLVSAGFRIVRFWNTDIDHMFDGVLQTIERALQEPHPAACGVHPPPAGEG